MRQYKTLITQTLCHTIKAVNIKDLPLKGMEEYLSQLMLSHFHPDATFGPQDLTSINGKYADTKIGKHAKASHEHLQKLKLFIKLKTVTTFQKHFKELKSCMLREKWVKRRIVQVLQDVVRVRRAQRRILRYSRKVYLLKLKQKALVSLRSNLTK